MSRIAYVNGRYIPFRGASIHVEDRGFQFADGVYEVIRLYRGKPFTLDEHLARLEKSAAGISLPMPRPAAAIKSEIHRLIDATKIGEGMIYLQLTRGHALRNHVFPAEARATLLFYARELEPLTAAIEATPPVKVISAPDERWQRCWIKSIALLPNVLAKNAAVAAGGDEAIFIDDGFVTECSASNFFAVIGGKLVTCPVGPKVLPGITRAVLLDAARQLGVPVEERAIAVEEARGADELFITSTTREISPVSIWDGKPAGRSRAVTTRLHRALRERIAAAR